MTTASRLSLPLGEAIFSLRAIRRLRPDPIPDADIRDILEAAIRAPNGGNTQQWHFLARMPNCALNLVPCTMKPGGPNAAMPACIHRRICRPIQATKPVVALASDLQTHTTFIPSLDAGPVGHEFLYWHQKNQGFFVYALADTIVRFFNASGGLVASNTMHAGTVWEPSTLSNAVYRVVATGVIAMQTTGTTGYTSVPSSTGASVGRHFVCATTRGTTGALVVLAYEDATVTVFDLESGQLLYTQLVPRGTAWFQSGVGTRRLRLDSTGDVEVWAGDTAGGTTLAQLGDDLSVTTGRQGQE